MTMLRMIEEEPYIEEAPSPQPYESKLPSTSPWEETSQRSLAVSPDMLQPVKEQLDMEDSGSDWDDETSCSSREEDKKEGMHDTQQSSNHEEPVMASPPPVHPAQLYQEYKMQAPRLPQRSSKMICHQTFLERLGRILCNHSAAIDTSDDTSVIVEISPTNVNQIQRVGGWDEYDTSAYISTEERKRQAMKRSQEEYLLNVILEQKQQLNNLW